MAAGHLLLKKKRKKVEADHFHLWI